MDGENESVALNAAEGDTTDPESPAQETSLPPPAEPQSTDPISDGNPIQEENEARQGSPDDNDELTQEDSTEYLLQAAQNGNKAEVERVLSTGRVDINSHSGFRNETALHKATRSGHLEVVEMLLERPDIKVDAVTSGSKTVLHLAAESGQLKMMQLLLERTRIDIDAAGYRGETALHIAAEGGSLDIVQELLKKHANINKMDGIKDSALHKAAEQGHFEIVQEILQWAVDQGKTAPNSDSTANQGDGPKEPVQLFDINAKNISGDTALTLAAWKGHSKVVEILLQQNANVDEADDCGTMPLAMAAYEGHVDIVKILLAHNSKTEPKDRWGFTALTGAIWYNYIEIVEKLLAANAALEDRGDDGNTPLHFAAARGHADVVKLLLDKKAEIDAQNDDGWTPVFSAVKEGHYEVLECLLEWENPSPNLNISTSDGRSLLYEAAERWTTENTGNGTNNETEEVNDTAPDDRGSTKSKDREPMDSSGQGNGISLYERITDLLLRKIVLDEDGRRIELIRAASRKQDPKTWRFLFKKMSWQKLSRTDLEKEADFVWHATNGEHKKLRELLKKEANLPSEGRPEDKYTVLQWAAYLGMYVIVWKLIRNGWQSEDKRKAALDVAEERRKLLQAPTQEATESRGNPEEKDGKPDNIPTRKPGDRKMEGKQPILRSAVRATERTTERRTERTEKDPESQIDYSITVDILKDPPFLEVSNEPVPDTQHPSHPKTFEEISGNSSPPWSTFTRGTREWNSSASLAQWRTLSTTRTLDRRRS
jgi:ankyrin repeat protein